MPTLTTQYVYFGSDGAHTRQPRATTSYGGFTPIPGLNPSGTATLATGTAFQAGPVEQSLSVGGLNLVFGYTNVSGCVEGGLTSFVSATPPPVGTVGTSPILVLVVYLPVGGGPGGSDTGAVIDAFNVSTGSLVDNDFVAVSPDSGGALTNEANVDGWVDTTDAGYTITADHPNIGTYMALPTGAVFEQWVILTEPTPPAGLVTGANLNAGEGLMIYALAFYKNPILKRFKEHIKEIDKEHAKELLKDHAEVPQKTLTFENWPKSLKENVEVPGLGGNIGDPGDIIGELRSLNQRLAKLEGAQKAALKGKAFIKPEDRPAVGPAKARKRR